MKRAVFLDRDGVLNRAIVRDGKPYAPASINELEILPGVETALAALRAAGFLLIVVTNQPDVARGSMTKEAVERINGALRAVLPLDEFRTCYHRSADGCACRKPKPGALLAAASAHDIHLSESYMVGDRWRDIEAGQNAGCKTIFVDYNYQERQPDAADYCVKSLREAAELILRRWYGHENSQRSEC
jgi:D-glycero-D-manno-heptose 1,7-bisphosphate phosphatase